jgi:ribonuclease BN (tRNA processing enzyme)
VSSILLQTSRGNVLFDCGENTVGQLSRQFGIDPEIAGNVFEVIRNLRFVFISHIHGDHMMGLMRLLAKRNQVHCKFHTKSSVSQSALSRQLQPLPEYLYIICNPFVKTTIIDYDAIENTGIKSRLKFIDVRDITEEKQSGGYAEGLKQTWSKSFI